MTRVEEYIRDCELGVMLHERTPDGFVDGIFDPDSGTWAGEGKAGEENLAQAERKIAGKVTAIA